MPISRDPRNDRRRRVLRDAYDQDAPTTKRRRRRSDSDEEDPQQVRRGAGYSQDVRQACGVRLVQLIPVRHSSYLGALLISILIPSVLLTFHYMIYVSGSLQWYGHPLAVSLDASHPSSIASWFCSHLWLLCLGATVLTFQLRRHKLDDFDGEYRLWFWMVLTCLFASIDATTHISELFGLALTPWSQVNLGWSGPAVVKATLAVLIGLLGLRLCSELKSVPISLSLWLIGLVAWAGSASLAQEELRLDGVSLQFRIWLKAALWLGGLTAIWLAALSYLRHVYIEAQQRFLARGRLRNRNSVPLRQRLKDSLPRFQREEMDEDNEARERRGWVPGFLRNKQADLDDRENDATNEGTQESASERRRRERQERAELRELEKEEKRQRQQEQRAARLDQKAARRDDDEDQEVGGRRRLGWGRFFGRAAEDDEGELEEARANKQKLRSRVRENAADNEQEERRGGLLAGWLRRPKDEDDPEEYRKVRSDTKRSRRRNDNVSDDEDVEEKPRRSWFSRKSSAGVEGTDSSEELDSRDGATKTKKGFFSRFTLQPPDEDESDDGNSINRSNLPSTNPSEESEQPSRPLSRAERKRMKKRQRQNRAA